MKLRRNFNPPRVMRRVLHCFSGPGRWCECSTDCRDVFWRSNRVCSQDPDGQPARQLYNRKTQMFGHPYCHTTNRPCSNGLLVANCSGHIDRMAFVRLSSPRWCRLFDIASGRDLSDAVDQIDTASACRTEARSKLLVEHSVHEYSGS